MKVGEIPAPSGGRPDHKQAVADDLRLSGGVSVRVSAEELGYFHGVPSVWVELAATLPPTKLICLGEVNFVFGVVPTDDALAMAFCLVDGDAAGGGFGVFLEPWLRTQAICTTRSRPSRSGRLSVNSA